jgi:DNA-binding IclR family transcriptional regulator
MGTLTDSGFMAPMHGAKKKARKTPYSAPALEKGLDVLELLSREDEGLTVSAIARRLGRSVSELFRMLVVLEQRGYIRGQPDSDKYQLSLKLFELAHRFRPEQQLTAIANPLMKEMAYEILQSCHLVIYYEGKGHVVAQQDSPSRLVFSVRLGAEVPLLDTCSGHVLLAYATDKQRKAMLAKSPRHLGPKSSVDLDTIVSRVRAQGYERFPSPQVAGVTDVGYPIFDHAGDAIAVLTVPYFQFQDASSPVPIDRAQEWLSKTALLISRELGYAR